MGIPSPALWSVGSCGGNAWDRGCGAIKVRGIDCFDAKEEVNLFSHVCERC